MNVHMALVMPAPCARSVCFKRGYDHYPQLLYPVRTHKFHICLQLAQQVPLLLVTIIIAWHSCVRVDYITARSLHALCPSYT
jgi:hypothetical protein